MVTRRASVVLGTSTHWPFFVKMTRRKRAGTRDRAIDCLRSDARLGAILEKLNLAGR
jgi:hypothetical protein